MNIPDVIKGISDKLNITALLCDKSWIAFNDDDVKTLFIFDKDGSLIISNNGVAVNSTWKYIKANKTILINDNGTSFLLHPAFINDVLFILQQDGTQQYLLLINESKSEQLLLHTLTAINNYINDLAENADEKNEHELATKTAKDEERQKLWTKIESESQAEIADKTAKLRTYRAIGISCEVVALLALIIACRLQCNSVLLFFIVLLPIITLIVVLEINDRILNIKEDIIRKKIEERDSK